MLSRSIFSNIVKRSLHSNVAVRKNSTQTLTESHKFQEEAMNENLMVVDENDNIIGSATKRECHKVQKSGDGTAISPLHRAFSVFVFNSHGDLLLQKRAKHKITYPERYTNSCCSHPLFDAPGEMIEKDALGVKKAAQRRLNFELGIPINELPLEKLNYITRFHYTDEGDGNWGEQEISWLLFFQGDVPLMPSSDEISEVRFIPRENLDECVAKLGTLSPWFELILKTKLKFWWDNLHNLEKIKDHENIVRLDIEGK